MNLKQLKATQRQFSKTLCQPAAQFEAVKPKKRFAVYQNAYEIRLTESLKEDFPECQKQLGEERFSNLLRHYVQTNPSSYWSLAQLSEDFYQHISRLHPELRELAHFEWQLILTQLSAYEQPFDFSKLACLDTQQQESFFIRLIKSAHFAHKNNSTWLLFRNQESIQELKLKASEAAVLKEIGLGTTLGKISLLFSKLDEFQVSNCFASWTSLGILTKGKE